MSAMAAVQAGNHGDAVTRGELLVAAAQKLYGADHEDTRNFRIFLSKLLIKDNQLQRARILLEELERTFVAIKDPVMLADVQFSLAKAVRESEPARAKALANQAMVAYRAAGTVRAGQLPDVQTFLASLPP